MIEIVFRRHIMDDPTTPELGRICIAARHFRNYEGRNVSQYGGHTALFDADAGVVITSKCRGNETYGRRKGILTCLQKMLRSKTKRPDFIDDSCEEIMAVGFRDGKMILHVSKRESGSYWWLFA